MLWHDPAMPTVQVLEFNRSEDGVWNLPPEFVDQLRSGFPDVTFTAPRTQAEADAALPEADIVFGWAVRPANFGRARRLRWIQVSAAGVGPLLFPELVASDVVVTNGRGLHAVAMAEHALGVMLAFARKLHLARDAQRRREWAQVPLIAGAPPFDALEGSTLGIVGFGRVGEAVATRARALGMRVIAVRAHPARDPAPAHEQWGVDRLDELVAAARWIVLAPALTPETRGMFGADRIARMRPDAVLVNLGRGALVDEAALAAALAAGRIAGAALDVTAREPLDPASPLWGMENVILTPHISGVGPRYWERSVELFARNLAAWNAGRPLENLVDKQAGY